MSGIFFCDDTARSRPGAFLVVGDFLIDDKKGTASVMKGNSEWNNFPVTRCGEADAWVVSLPRADLFGDIRSLSKCFF